MIARYSRPAMTRVWSEEAKLARWLEVELASLEGWAHVGAFPADTVAAIRARATAPDPRARRRARGGHEPRRRGLRRRGRRTLGDDGRWFHYGLTSSDVVDTALALQIRDAGELILDGLGRAFDAVVARAEEHRGTITMGRTHGIHAEPTTFGLKLAGWAFALARDRARVERALEGMRVGKLSGAVGQYAAVEPEVERIACERLGLEAAPIVDADPSA